MSGQEEVKPFATNSGSHDKGRSSSGQGMFEGLQQAKRSDDNERTSAARQSLTDQQPAKGVIGQMFDKTFKGNPGK